VFIATARWLLKISLQFPECREWAEVARPRSYAAGEEVANPAVPRERTTTDEEIEALAARIVAQVSKRTGGVLRG
jgi:hypothetical protein